MCEMLLDISKNNEEIIKCCKYFNYLYYLCVAKNVNFPYIYDNDKKLHSFSMSKRIKALLWCFLTVLGLKPLPLTRTS